MNRNQNENKGVHGKSINYYTGTGHCPRMQHTMNGTIQKKKDSLSD